MTKIRVMCMNKKCGNYKQELNEGTEICSLCNEKTKKFETNVNKKFAVAAVCAALIGIILYTQGYGLVYFASFVITPVSVILGFISRSKAAIITVSLIFLIIVVLFIYFYIFA